MRVLLGGGVDDAGVVEAVRDDADAGGEVGLDLVAWRWSGQLLALHNTCVYIHVYIYIDIYIYHMMMVVMGTDAERLTYAASQRLALNSR